MTHPHVDPSTSPFEKPPAPQLGKMTFGTLRLLTKSVNLKTGASYVVDDLGIDPDPDNILNRLTDQNGNLREFRGKQVSPSGGSTHVIVVITTRHSDGHLYNACRDFMYWDSDKSQRITMPSLQKHFGGQKLPGIWGKTAEVQAEVVNYIELGKKDQMTGERAEYSRQAYKVVKVFKDQAERETAEQAFFAQFQTAVQTPDQIAAEMDGEDAIPWGADGEPIAPTPSSAPVEMAADAAVGLLTSLLVANGQDKDKCVKQLGGMPVVTAALRGIKEESRDGFIAQLGEASVAADILKSYFV